jgi:hypothetical protein
MLVDNLDTCLKDSWSRTVEFTTLDIQHLDGFADDGDISVQEPGQTDCEIMLAAALYVGVLRLIPLNRIPSFQVPRMPGPENTGRVVIMRPKVPFS